MSSEKEKSYDGAYIYGSGLADIKSICKQHGISNSVEYKERYKEIPGLPSHPERMFSDEWTSYTDFFDLPQIIPFKELRKLVRKNGIKSQSEYRAWVSSLDDPRYPRAPHEAYSSEWDGWYDFCGKEKPFKPQNISSNYKEWGDKIEEFMKQAQGGGSKQSHLCRFVRTYIEKHEKSRSPIDLLTKKRVYVGPFREELKKLPSDNYRRNMIIAVNEFLNYVINKYLTDEDEETGEITLVMNARNPFQRLANDISVSAPIRNESTKPCLQYSFVRRAQEWIIPNDAKTFEDLKHLQKFDTDWVQVDRSIVDYSDPDCISRKIGSKYYIWCPTDWIQTYALTKVPLRGRQISYNDSGEGDSEIAEIDENGRIIWVKNASPFAGSTKAQSFIKKMPDDNIGMYVTTNKTSNNFSGYSIPWMPEDLAYWLVRLRRWQQKYNPINEPMPWSQCVRTNLNEVQLKAKGINCFLFRGFGEREPKNPTSVLTIRLAAALYHIQPSTLELSKCLGSKHRLSNYRSKYTPHSMRVSLITAYIMEMGMPVEIVMKVVGHSSIVMSIYYCKVTQKDIRQKFEGSEKRALKSQADAIQATIEQNNIESVKNQLVGSNQDLLQSLTNAVPAGNFVFRDYGICPFAATRCDDGGEEIRASNIRSPAPAGYLGYQNCMQCRHFITGPAFLGGLLSLTNEILLEANEQSHMCGQLQDKVSAIQDRLAELDRMEYLANAKQIPFDGAERNPLELKLRKLESEYESAAKKMDMLLCDLQASYKHIQLSQSAANSQPDSESDRLALIKSNSSEIQISIEDTSHFQQLHEICENSTIYESCNPSRAITPRSQLLDRMAAYNELAPSLFMLSEEEQLVAGNQIVALLKSRLSSWKKINHLINGQIKLSELIGPERIEPSELEIISKNALPSAV